MQPILFHKDPDGRTLISMGPVTFISGVSFKDIDFDRITAFQKAGTCTFKEFSEGMALISSETYLSISPPPSKWRDMIGYISSYWEQVYDKYFHDIDDSKEQERQQFKFQNRLMKLERPRTIDRSNKRRKGSVLGHGKRGRV